jgi:hypothetical protein
MVAASKFSTNKIESCERTNSRQAILLIEAEHPDSEKSWPLSGIAIVSESVLGGTNTASYAFGMRGGEFLRLFSGAASVCPSCLPNNAEPGHTGPVGD